MGGPAVFWKSGRIDKDPRKITAKEIPPNGRLPDASRGPPHLRDIFYRMGFNDQDIVALSGAHCTHYLIQASDDAIRTDQDMMDLGHILQLDSRTSTLNYFSLLNGNKRNGMDRYK